MPDYSGLLGALNAVGPQMQPMNVTDQTPATPNPVPTFTPPPNPAVPIHHGFLSRIGAALTNGVAPVPSGLDGLLSQSDLAHARSAGWLALSNSLLNPSLDARGFKQSTLGSIASGLQGAQQASAQSMGGALQASQYATGIAQNQHIQQTRQQIEAGLSQRIQAESDPAAQLNLIEDAGVKSAAAGDFEAAGKYAALAKSVREGRIATAQAGKTVYTPLNVGDKVGRFNHSTGEAEFIDPKTGEWAQATDLTRREIATVIQEKARTAATGEVNSKLKDQSMYNNGPGKEFEKARAAYDNFDAVANELAGTNGKPNPAALRKFVSAFGQAAAPQIQYRLGTLMYEEPLDVSLRGRLKSLAAGIESGTADPGQIEDARHLVATLRARTAAREAEVAGDYAKKSPHGFGAVRTVLNPQPGAKAPGGKIDMSQF